jgi:hypothetical protein
MTSTADHKPLLAGQLCHGGLPGLSVGDRILPPAQTGVMTPRDVVREHDPLMWQRQQLMHRYAGGGYGRPDKVYVGAIEVAIRFAVMWTLNPEMPGQGAVYEVQPEGEVTPDPALLMFPGGAMECDSAVITKVAIPGVSRARAVRSDPGWYERERYLRQLAKARAEGRSLTAGDHLAREAWARSLRARTLAFRALGL